MSTEENKRLVRRFIEEIFVKGSIDAVDELVAADFVPRSWPGVKPGREGLREAIKRVSSGLSDVSMTIEDMIAEDDRVAVRLTSRAVHRGTFMGMEASGKSYAISEIHIFRLSNGKVMEHWREADLLGMMQQLGAMPAPGQSRE